MNNRFLAALEMTASFLECGAKAASPPLPLTCTNELSFRPTGGISFSFYHLANKPVIPDTNYFRSGQVRQKGEIYSFEPQSFPILITFDRDRFE